MSGTCVSGGLLGSIGVVQQGIGTTKKSIEAMSFTWLSRKVRQVWDGGFLDFCIIRLTVR